MAAAENLNSVDLLKTLRDQGLEAQAKHLVYRTEFFTEAVKRFVKCESPDVGDVIYELLNLRSAYQAALTEARFVKAKS